MDSLTSPPSPTTFAAGTTISHYEIVARLGEGGMGVVYKAFDKRLKRAVALKFLNAKTLESERGKQRFLFEAQAAAALDHPNICPIYEIDEADGHTFITMACISGGNLRRRLQHGPLAVQEALPIAAQVAQGLAAAHERRVVHRDIKPANLILSDDGLVKIVDFGLAFGPESARITAAGMPLGTLAYMSPEQARGETLDHRTDLWSWGVVLYEMLSGTLPFWGGNLLALIDAITRKDPKPIRDSRLSLPEGLERIIERALEKSPERRFQSAKEIIAQLEGISGAAVVLATRPFEVVPAQARISGPSGSAVSMAVLPFVNLSSDPENEFFSDGLTDELINVLARCSGLRVVSRTSAFAFKGKSENIRSIGEQLHVNAVVEGSVRRSGDRLRVTAQLINVADGYHLWSGRFDRDMKDVFAVQDEIAQTVANALETSLSWQGTPAARPKSNLEAYHLYLKGRYYWNQMTAEGFQKAISNFEGALKLDPSYGAAYAGVADYFTTLALWSLAPPSEVWPKAKAAALKALDLDGSLPEAHIALGYVHVFYERDRLRGEREFRRAVELNRGLSFAHYSYSIYLVQAGRLNEAIEAMNTAKNLDPLSPLVCSGLAFIYYYARQYDRAQSEHLKVLDLDPRYVYSLLGLGLVHAELGNFRESIPLLEQARDLSGGSPLILGFLGGCYGRAGETAKALAVAQQLDQQTGGMYVSPICQALLYAGLNDKNRVLDWLEKAVESRAALLAYFRVMPVFDPLRAEPRMAALERLLEIPMAEEPTIENPGPSSSSAGETVAAGPPRPRDASS